MSDFFDFFFVLVAIFVASLTVLIGFSDLDGESN
jgi:hypothetical protein